MTLAGGLTGPRGALGLTVIRGGQVVDDPPRYARGGMIDAPSIAGELAQRWPSRQLTIPEIGRFGFPQKGLPAVVNAWRKSNRQHLARGLRKVIVARAAGIPHFYGQLFLDVFRGDGSVEQLGLASMRLVTTVGVRFICDDFNNNTTDVTTMKFHGFGTGGAAEAVGNTALTTELTTQYVSDIRPTGSQASATVTNDATYTTVATLSPDSGGTIAVTEHGIFSASSVGTLLDKSLFSAVNLVASADSLQATYVLTVVAGG